MFIIGITGPTGAGKTSALRALEALNARALDCDKIYHKLLADNPDLKSELDARFPGVLQNGVIDRKALGEIVFNDGKALSDLNVIAHKYVGYATSQSIDDWARSGGTVVAIEAIALIESGIAKKCDVVVGITAPADMRIKRIMERDGLTQAGAEQRVNAQKTDSFFEENCDYVLKNVYTNPDEFEEKCMEFFNELIGGKLK